MNELEFLLWSVTVSVAIVIVGMGVTIVANALHNVFATRYVVRAEPEKEPTDG